MSAAAHQHHATEQQQHQLVQGPLPASQHILPASLANGSRKGKCSLLGQRYATPAVEVPIFGHISGSVVGLLECPSLLRKLTEDAAKAKG